MSRRILITGGFGYVGGRVAQVLAATPDVHVVLGSREIHNVPRWLPSASVTVTAWDDPKSIRQACTGVDAILHLAAMNEIDATRDPVGALQVNGVLTARLIEVAKGEGVRRFIYVSTAHVYGSPLVGRIDETTCPRPTHPYATSHRAAEDVVLAAHITGALTGLVLRLSNGFGVPVHANVNRWTLLVNDLCRQSITARRLTLRSPGLQRRDFVTLEDAGRAVAHLINVPDRLVGDGVFNIGGSWAPTVREVASLVADRCEAVMSYRPAIQAPDPSPGDVSQPLDYRIDRLMKTGFGLTGNHAAEIDAILLMCRSQAE